MSQNNIKSLSMKAIQFDGDNKFDVAEMCKGNKFDMLFEEHSIIIDTDNGLLTLIKGDWLVKNESGKLSVLENHIFERLFGA